jgi:thiamine kinase-like enzyme
VFSIARKRSRSLPRLLVVLPVATLTVFLAPSATVDAASSAENKMRQLINQDARVPVSLGHGDLVKSNMLFANDSVVLIDWEHARAMPIAFDLSKLVFRAGAVASAVELIRQQWKGSLAATRDGYRVEEQLALGLAQMLAWTASREQRAKAIGRAEAFRLDSQRRVKVLEQLLDMRSA